MFFRFGKLKLLTYTNMIRSSMLFLLLSTSFQLFECLHVIAYHTFYMYLSTPLLLDTPSHYVTTLNNNKLLQNDQVHQNKKSSPKSFMVYRK